MVYDSVTAAALAGLVISDKTKPGITREYVDLSENSDEKTFRWDYFLPNGKKITDEDGLISSTNWLSRLLGPKFGFRLKKTDMCRLLEKMQEDAPSTDIIPIGRK